MFIFILGNNFCKMLKDFFFFTVFKWISSPTGSCIPQASNARCGTTDLWNWKCTEQSWWSANWDKGGYKSWCLNYKLHTMSLWTCCWPVCYRQSKLPKEDVNLDTLSYGRVCYTSWRLVYVLCYFLMFCADFNMYFFSYLSNQTPLMEKPCWYGHYVGCPQYCNDGFIV